MKTTHNFYAEMQGFLDDISKKILTLTIDKLDIEDMRKTHIEVINIINKAKELLKTELSLELND